jgi:pyruvate,water dikinase
MTSSLIIPLAAAQQSDVARVGGKAATLGELHQAGFPVPAGLCVTTAALTEALASYQPQLQQLLGQANLTVPVVAQTAATTIANLLADLTLPTALENALAAALPDLADETTSLVVRSSATDEDGATASFAGQYATTLGVHGPAALQAAIVDGWRSFYSANALAARAAQGAPVENEGMALLIQPLLTAECAGVAFSVDPVQERRDRLVINAAWGLGAGVVDGTVATDTVWIKRADLSVDQQQIVEKRQAIAGDGHGNLIHVAVPVAQQRTAVLPPAWLERVAQLTVAVESYLGVPQDIEWAVAAGRLWLLQARPITGLPTALTRITPFPVTWHRDEDQRALWRHERQGDPNRAAELEVLRPLELDNMRDMAAMREEGCRLLGAERNQATKLCNGRVYVRSIPMPWTAADQRIRQAAMRDLRARLHEQGLTIWDYWGPEIIKATDRLRTFDRENATGSALADHLEEVLAVRRRHMPLHPAMNFRPPQSYYDAFAALSGLDGDEAKAAADRLVDTVETPLTQLIDELYALACLARQDAAVTELVTQASPDIMTTLRTLPQAAPFLTHFDEFLDRYRERTGDGWGSQVTLTMPTWREAPAIVCALLAPYLTADVTPPAVRRAQAHAEREVALATLCAACPDPAVVAEFRRQLAYARKVSAVVEQHNHYLDQMYTGQLRQAVIAAGRRLVEQGILATVDEIFWLHFAEIGELLRTSDARDVRTIIATRQAAHQSWQMLETPPILGLPAADLPARPEWRDEVSATNPHAATDRPDHLTGLGVSHGRRRGRARIVTDPFVLPELKPGDILVAKNIGPTLTPLFPILGGLVLEKGSVGQHAAATAREYGLPTAIQVKDATKLIADGSWITVDGEQGTVGYGDAVSREGQ